jgi:hypothetical protein
MTLPLRDLSGLDSPALERLGRTLARVRTLEDVLALLRPLGLALREIVTQDEYTHDIVLSWEGGRHLVLDCT